MKFVTLSLAALMSITTASFAAETLADAFKNGKVAGELKAWYWDRTDEGNFGSPVPHNENIFNLGIELGYVTDSFYGFRMGLTFQGSATPFAESNAKALFVNEAAASGSVLSEGYLGYTLGKTDIKIGRQYINTPLISGNYTRIFKESFEGVTLKNTDLPQTTIFANYVNKFQGRTSDVTGSATNEYSAPEFAKKIILAGAGPESFAFEDVYGLGVINQSLTNLKLTAQYAVATDIANQSILPITAKDDLSLYYVEVNYLLPMNGFKLGFDANYRGSKTGGDLDSRNLEGNMLGLRIALSELNGFGASLAYTTVSDSDDVILGLGNGPGVYTVLPIRGPLVYSNFAGMDSYKIALSYDLEKVGIKGLKAGFQYLDASQSSGSTTTAHTGAVTHNVSIEGYAGMLSYAVPTIKGLTTDLIYVTFDKEATSATNVTTNRDTNELWFNANYKF